MSEENFVIVSEAEEGFWSNELGWVYDIDSATRFSELESATLSLPVIGNADAKWMSESDARSSYGELFSATPANPSAPSL